MVVEERIRIEERADREKVHRSDCALHNAPAFQPGPCDCSIAQRKFR